MNLYDIIQPHDKPLATKNILKGNGSATLIRIKKDGVLDKHQSRTDALLVLLSGKAVYEEEDRTISLIQAHDFVNIPEKVTHSVRGEEDSLLMLIQ
ncbi:MAG: quercetin dioxygenase-like cupin family protein [Saprospiraceae bacterium]|jgi:quercetin dioxygenase-like cupin family protein